MLKEAKQQHTTTSIHIVYFLLPWKAGRLKLNNPFAT